MTFFVEMRLKLYNISVGNKQAVNSLFVVFIVLFISKNIFIKELFFMNPTEMKTIKKREIIKLVAKSLGKGFTIPMVETTYKAIENTIKNILIENDSVKINLADGLIITSCIKPEYRNYIMPDGQRVIQPPRKWVHAKITSWFNRVVINHLEH